MSAGALQPTLFIAHGAGPWPYMDGEFRALFSVLETSLRELPASLPQRPAALLLVSAHWEETDFRVMEAERPGMLYDYGGFPPHTYQVRYPAPGAPALAQRVRALLGAAGLACSGDAGRGFDHGVFAPLAVMYPAADVPVLQLSLRRDLDAAAHLRAGAALATLRAEGVLIIGSGFSYHNMAGVDARAVAASKTFDDWLQQVLVRHDPALRERSLADWEQAPAARQAHPRAEHLLPLMVAAGAAAGEPGSCCFHQQDMFGGITISSFRFG
jgi:aromatic ring-opening dioxygenase catalytic subunit (LigB family)